VSAVDPAVPAGMYAFPVIFLILLAIVTVAWSQVLALVVAALLFIGFLAYVGLRPRL
jgi:hypothetical protein